jgi:hypothetical protein
MPNLSALSRGTQLLLGAGVLLLIDTFLEWQSVEVGPFSVGENAWSGFWGIIMGLALLVLLGWVVARLFDVKLPAGLPEGPITVGLGALVFVFALLKNLIDDYTTIWAYIGVVLAAGVAYGAWLRYQETGGTVESLKASLPARETASTSPGATSEPSAPPPTPPPTSTPPVDDEARTPEERTPGT